MTRGQEIEQLRKAVTALAYMVISLSNILDEAQEEALEKDFTKRKSGEICIEELGKILERYE